MRRGPGADPRSRSPESGAGRGRSRALRSGRRRPGSLFERAARGEWHTRLVPRFVVARGDGGVPRRARRAGPRAAEGGLPRRLFGRLPGAPPSQGPRAAGRAGRSAGARRRRRSRRSRLRRGGPLALPHRARAGGAGGAASGPVAVARTRAGVAAGPGKGGSRGRGTRGLGWAAAEDAPRGEEESGGGVRTGLSLGGGTAIMMTNLKGLNFFFLIGSSFRAGASEVEIRSLLVDSTGFSGPALGRGRMAGVQV